MQSPSPRKVFPYLQSLTCSPDLRQGLNDWARYYTHFLEGNPSALCGKTAPGACRQAGRTHLRLRRARPASARAHVGQAPARLPDHGVSGRVTEMSAFTKAAQRLITASDAVFQRPADPTAASDSGNSCPSYTRRRAGCGRRPGPWPPARCTVRRCI